MLSLVPFALSFWRDHRRWLLGGGPAPRSAEFHRQRAERLVATIGALGPTFVKLAQVLAARADLVPEPYLAALGTLVDRVPSIPRDAVERAIEASYGRPASQVFEEFDPVPLAAASLGQVHRARADGRDVVVKVLRPGVEALVARDVRRALWVLRIAERRFPNPHVRGLVTIVQEFGDRIGEEMDFRREAEYAAEIRANIAGMRGVHVPEVLPAYTRQRTLVLTYAPGRRIDDIAPLVASGRVRTDDLVRRIIELYVRMMLVDGLFHADPHPGNLLVQDDGTLVLLDFGMVVRVPRETRRELMQTVLSAIRQDAEGVVEGFYALGIILPEADRTTIVALARRLMALATERTTTEERIQRMLADEVMHTLYDWPVVLPREMVYFARTAALIEGIGTRYDPHFNAIDVSAPLVLRLRPLIVASLRGDAGAPPEDWPTVVGGVLGRVAGIVARASRDVATVIGEELALGGTGLARHLR